MQTNALSDRAFLVILELSAEWPDSPSGRAPCTLVVQSEAEGPQEFASRVKSRLAQAAAGGLRFSGGVLAINERLDPGACAARAEIAENVARALAAAEGGELRVTASDRNDGRSRVPLTTWLQALVKQWRPRGVQCKLHLTGGAPKSEPKSKVTRKSPARRSVSESIRRVA